MLPFEMQSIVQTQADLICMRNFNPDVIDICKGGFRRGGGGGGILGRPNGGTWSDVVKYSNLQGVSQPRKIN